MTESTEKTQKKIIIELSEDDRQELIGLLHEIRDNIGRWGDNTVLGCEFYIEFEQVKLVRRLLNKLR
jgi:hypothetical protein